MMTMKKSGQFILGRSTKSVLRVSNVAIPIANIISVTQYHTSFKEPEPHDAPWIQIQYTSGENQGYRDIWGTVEEFGELMAENKASSKSSIAEAAMEVGFELAHLRDVRDELLAEREAAEEGDWFSQAAIDARAAHLTSADRVDAWAKNHEKNQQAARKSSYIKPDEMNERR